VKVGIHPDYIDTTITCACGEVVKTRSTKPEIRVEVCSKCHPFYTGKQKFMDTAGRVERFQRKYKRQTPSNAWRFPRAGQTRCCGLWPAYFFVRAPLSSDLRGDHDASLGKA